jgi:hypothetical protein
MNVRFVETQKIIAEGASGHFPVNECFFVLYCIYHSTHAPRIKVILGEPARGLSADSVPHRQIHS